MKPVPEAKSVAISVAVLSHVTHLHWVILGTSSGDKGRVKETSGQRARSAGTARSVGWLVGCWWWWCFTVRVEAFTYIFQK